MGGCIQAIFHADFVSLKKLELYCHALAQNKNEIKVIKMTIIFFIRVIMSAIFIKMIIIIKEKSGQNE
jgi:hypothetical protein